MTKTLKALDFCGGFLLALDTLVVQSIQTDRIDCHSPLEWRIFLFGGFPGRIEMDHEPRLGLPYASLIPNGTLSCLKPFA